ncbi:MAG: NAD(P)H-hydrate epimerase [Flavobacteriales bacterium]|nr:NAD(P)H-hydrate epimerase [Flavobacteriales bacterium]
MLPVLTAEQVRQVDALTIAREPIGSTALMERAAAAFVQAFLTRYGDRPRPLLVLCGPGNNGGDGLVIARSLAERGWPVRVLTAYTEDQASADNRHQLQRLFEKRVERVQRPDGTLPSLRPGEWVIDALYGTGLNRPPRDEVLQLIRELNAQSAAVVAVDLPSGAYADGGPDDPTAVVKASATFSFQVPKRFLMLPEHADRYGERHVVDIGLDRAAIAACASDLALSEVADVVRLLPSRPAGGHKGTFGHALLLAGGTGHLGAAVMAAAAVLLMLLRRKEEAFRAKASLAAIVESTDDAIVTKRFDGTITSWNAAAERMFGYRAEEVLGRRVDAIVPPDRADEEAGLTDLVRRGEVLANCETVRLRRDGTRVDVSITVSPVRDAGGAIIGASTIARDVTERKRAEAKFRSVLELAPDAMVIVNEEGRIVLVNAETERMFGYGRDELMGQPVEILMPERARASYPKLRAEYAAAPRVREMGTRMELRGLRKDGTEFPVEISLSPIDADSGRLVMSAIRDTSERKRFEQALREKNDELERAIRAKDLFLATMSHELRTPLNAIIGFTGLMLMKLPGPLNAAQERQLTLVQSSGQHLLSLINDLLDLAKIESGRVELTLEPVRCLAVLEEAAATLRPAASTKGLTIIVATDGGELHVQADRRALQQIVLNLGSNAVKFSQRGIVRLEARANASNGDGQRVVELAVADEGVGISTEDQARLFQPFMQVGAQARRPAEGTGLGLHLSRKLAELMQSDLRVQSEPGVGSRFSLRLPRIEPPAAAGGSPPAEP